MNTPLKQNSHPRLMCRTGINWNEETHDWAQFPGSQTWLSAFFIFIYITKIRTIPIWCRLVRKTKPILPRLETLAWNSPEVQSIFCSCKVFKITQKNRGSVPSLLFYFCSQLVLIPLFFSFYKGDFWTQPINHKGIIDKLVVLSWSQSIL